MENRLFSHETRAFAAINSVAKNRVFSMLWWKNQGESVLS
jgi:hypothetical protein